MLERAMERAKACDLLEDREYSASLTMGEFERLMLRAGYSVKDAHKAALRHGWARLEAGQMM